MTDRSARRPVPSSPPRRALAPAAVLLLAAALAACAPEPGPVDSARAEPAPATARRAAEPAPVAEDLRAAGRAVAEALRDRDFEALARRAHPGEGVRFSPYAYVDPSVHVTLSAAQLRAAGGEGRGSRRTWGHQDGTGEPIEMTVEEYFDRFVYDAPYLEEGSVGVDQRQGGGNSLDNAGDIYPDGRIVEYHVPGRNPDYGGMDWRSLRLVFEPSGDGGWTLVGVIHDEWTI